MVQGNVISRSHQATRWGVYKSLLAQNKQDLEQSWQRCTDAGMDPGDIPECIRITNEELQSYCGQEGRSVRGLARAELLNLYKNLGKRSVTLTFASVQGVILDQLPNRGAPAGYQGSSDLAPGNCWYEMSRGTNAVGTSASTKRTTVVLGGDHFLRTYYGLICIAKPVFGANGGIAGIIDVTLHGRDGQMDIGELGYILGLMHMSADHIETELFKQQHRGALVIQTNFGVTVASDGNAAFAFDETGRLENASRAAFDAIGDFDIDRGVRFEDIFRADFDRLYSGGESLVDFAQIEDCNGRYLYVTVYPPEVADDVSQVKLGTTAGTRVRSAPASDNMDGGFLSGDPVVKDALAVVDRATDYNAPIMIRGETGTGKELLARHIHRASGRAGEFVTVNCAAVPESLIEAELFGYEGGAFTGARKGGALGLAREADNGTLFLDEIGDMPYDLQARLLRMLDSWRIRPVGSEREYEVDVQLVTATNRDLEAAVERGEFRLDLFHRIQVVNVPLPALRNRSDFDEIVRALFVEIEPNVRVQDGALAQMRQLRWPGNIRELRNAITRLIIRAESNTITAALVKNELLPGAETGGMHITDRAFAALADDDIETVFKRCHSNISATARALGISRTTVYKHLRNAKTTEENVDE